MVLTEIGAFVTIVEKKRPQVERFEWGIKNELKISSVQVES